MRGVTLEVAQGEVFCLLGPNGAGKTSIVEILEGYRERDGGDATVCGMDPALRARLPGAFPLCALACRARSRFARSLAGRVPARCPDAAERT